MAIPKHRKQRFNLIVNDVSPGVTVNPSVLIDAENDEVFPGFGATAEDNWQIRPNTIKQKLEYIEHEREYVGNGEDPGVLVIFNQKHFDNPAYPTRAGTITDINALIQTFGNLGFNITKDNIHNDSTREDILNKLKTLSREDHSKKRNCLIIFILTHGDENNALQTKDAPVYVDEVWNLFTMENCPYLKDKPKLFFFQACKGINVSQPAMDKDAPKSFEKNYSSELVPSAFFSTPLERDMLVAFASVEGNVSYRHIFEGAWFIQELCQNISAYGQFDDVMSLLIKTAKCVGHNYYDTAEPTKSRIPNEQTGTMDSEPVTVIKQMPVFISTLRKRFYFNRSNERNQLLRMVQQLRQIEELVVGIETKIESFLE